MRRSSILAALFAATAVGCGQPAPSAPTETPPAAPTIRLGDWQSSNGRWTFNATVNPRGSPTDVILEYGLGTETAPVFDRTLALEKGLLEPRSLTATVELPEESSFCIRFTATNEVGSASAPRCSIPFSFPSVVSVPEGSAGGSASP